MSNHDNEQRLTYSDSRTNDLNSRLPQGAKPSVESLGQSEFLYVDPESRREVYSCSQFIRPEKLEHFEWYLDRYCNKLPGSETIEEINEYVEKYITGYHTTNSLVHACIVNDSFNRSEIHFDLDDRRWILSVENGNYSMQINACPFCGTRLKLVEFSEENVVRDIPSLLEHFGTENLEGCLEKMPLPSEVVSDCEVNVAVGDFMYRYEKYDVKQNKWHLAGKSPFEFGDGSTSELLTREELDIIEKDIEGYFNDLNGVAPPKSFSETKPSMKESQAYGQGGNKLVPKEPALIPTWGGANGEHYDGHAHIRSHLLSLGFSETAAEEIFAEVRDTKKGMNFHVPGLLEDPYTNRLVSDCLANKVEKWCKQNKVLIPDRLYKQ